MSNGELENLWVSEKHDTATGKKLFIDMITNVNELSNVLVENHVARYVLPQLKKLTAPLIAFFHALELDLSNRSLQKRQSLSFALMNFLMFLWKIYQKIHLCILAVILLMVFLRSRCLLYSINCSGTKAILLSGLGN
jgi:hypothetical protein